MGLPITVTEKPSRIKGVVRFELNRSLTGMGHERYRKDVEVTGERPPDVLARRLFRGGIRALHVYGNEITLELEPGGDTKGVGDLIHGLFVHYTEGVTPSYP